MQNIKQQFGIRIKKIRLEKDMSQEVLAFKAKLHRTYISDIERGIKNVSIENIAKIANGLGVDLSVLFDAIG